MREILIPVLWIFIIINDFNVIFIFWYNDIYQKSIIDDIDIDEYRYISKYRYIAEA